MNQRFKLLSESVCEEVKVETVLNEETNEKKMFLCGIGLQANTRNKNQRIYPEAVLYEAVDRHVSEMMPLGRCAGELEHPSTGSHDINLDRISHKFVDVQKDNGNIFLKAQVLNTTCGIQLQNIVEGGVTIGFSSRSLGSIKNVAGENIVQPGLRIVSLADSVFNQSAHDAIANAIYENKEWVYENGVLVEKDIEPELDTYKQMIEKTTKADRAKVFEQIVLDYFKIIKVK